MNAARGKVDETKLPKFADSSDDVNQWLEKVFEDDQEVGQDLGSDSCATLRGSADEWTDISSDSELEDGNDHHERS